MNIVVLLGSPRPGGNSERMADAFIQGAEKAGNRVSRAELAKLQVNGCKACDYCRSHDGRCVQQDGMQEVFPLLYEADMVVFASPVYFFGLTAQIKAAIDRMYVDGGKKLPIRHSALLLCYADDTAATGEPSIQHYRAVANYMGWRDHGVVEARGVWEKGEIQGRPALEEARRLGESIH